MLKYFALIIVRPKRTIQEIIRADFKLRKTILFLFWLGLLRGILEVTWIFAINHRLGELSLISRQTSWWYLESGPFILANILTVYLRWAMYSMVFYLTLWFFKIKADFSIILKVFSVILCLYVLTIIMNFLHLFFNIPMVKFHISTLYSYSMGIGQLVSSCLFIFFIYKFGSCLGLDKLSSLLSGLFVFSVDRIFYFFSAWIYFRLPLVNSLSYKNIFNLGNGLSSIVSLLLTLVFLWLGYRINAQRKVNI